MFNFHDYILGLSTIILIFFIKFQWLLNSLLLYEFLYIYKKNFMRWKNRRKNEKFFYDFCFELKEIVFHLFSFLILKILVI